MIFLRLLLSILALTLFFQVDLYAQEREIELTKVPLSDEDELFSVQAATFLDNQSFVVSDRTLQKMFAFGFDGTPINEIKQPAEIHPGIEFSSTQLLRVDGKILALAMMATPSLFIYSDNSLTNGAVLFTKTGMSQGFTHTKHGYWVVPFGNSNLDLTLLDDAGDVKAAYPIASDFPNYALSSDRTRLFAHKNIIFVSTPLDYRVQRFDAEKREWLSPIDFTSYMKTHNLGVPLEKDIVAGPDMNAFMAYYNLVSEHFVTDGLTGNDSILLFQLTKGGSEYLTLLIDIATGKVVGHSTNEYALGGISDENDVLFYHNDKEVGTTLYVGKVEL